MQRMTQTQPDEHDPTTSACSPKQANTGDMSMATAPVERQGKRHAVLRHGAGAVRRHPYHLPSMERSHCVQNMGFYATRGIFKVRCCISVRRQWCRRNHLLAGPGHKSSEHLHAQALGSANVDPVEARAAHGDDPRPALSKHLQHLPAT